MQSPETDIANLIRLVEKIREITSGELIFGGFSPFGSTVCPSLAWRYKAPASLRRWPTLRRAGKGHKELIKKKRAFFALETIVTVLGE